MEIRSSRLIQSYDFTVDILEVYGRTRYTDIFGGLHWFKHCVYHSFHEGSYDAGTCTNYNNTGDGEFPPEKEN